MSTKMFDIFAGNRPRTPISRVGRSAGIAVAVFALVGLSGPSVATAAPAPTDDPVVGADPNTAVTVVNTLMGPVNSILNQFFPGMTPTTPAAPVAGYPSAGLPGYPSAGVPGQLPGYPGTGYPGAPNAGPGQLPGYPGAGVPSQLPGYPSAGVPSQLPGYPSAGVPSQLPGYPSTGAPNQLPGYPGATGQVPGAQPGPTPGLTSPNLTGPAQPGPNLTSPALPADTVATDSTAPLS